MNDKENLTEKEVRALRDNIYGEQSDKAWNVCRENWMRPDSIEFLIKHQPANENQ